MGYKSIIEGAPITIHYLHYLHYLHFYCAAITYRMKVVTQPTLNLHRLSPCVTTKVQVVQVVQVCQSLRSHITDFVRNFSSLGSQA